MLLAFTNLAMRVYRGGGEVDFLLVTPYPAADLRTLRFVQSADVLTVTHPAHPPREIRRMADDDWSIIEVDFTPDIPTPSASDVVLTKVGTGSGTTWRYKVTFENAGGEEGLPGPVETVDHTDTLSNDNRVSFAITLPAGVVRGNVYKYKGGSYGYIGSTGDGEFQDTGIAPALDETPPRARDPFAGDNHPIAVGYWQQRIAYGGSAANPDTAWLSKVGSYRNFTTAEPLRDDDAITLTLSSQQVNRIVGVLGLRALLLFTTGGVWSVKRGDRGLTPALEGGVDLESAIGASDLPPIVVGDAAAYVEAQRQRIHVVGYDAAKDSFGGEELTLLAAHLFREGRAVAWAYARSPWSVVWVVREDGALLSCTWQRDQNLIAWARHDTADGGRFEDVAVVEEDGASAPYFVVRRGAQRFLERMEVADWFVDAGLRFEDARAVLGVTADGTGVWLELAGTALALDTLVDVEGLDGAEALNGRRFMVVEVAGALHRLGDEHSGVPLDPDGVSAWVAGGRALRCVRSVSGLDHLEGRTVAIVADGSYDGTRTVVDGEIELTFASSRVIAGLPYVAELRTLPLPMPADQYGAKKRVVKLQVFCAGTRGLRVGPSPDELEEVPFRTDELMGEAGRGRDGMVEHAIVPRWSNGGQVTVRQALPLPAEVLAILPELELGR